jgi:hypothetical protein
MVGNTAEVPQELKLELASALAIPTTGYELKRN